MLARLANAVSLQFLRVCILSIVIDCAARQPLVQSIEGDTSLFPGASAGNDKVASEGQAVFAKLDKCLRVANKHRWKMWWCLEACVPALPLVFTTLLRRRVERGRGMVVQFSAEGTETTTVTICGETG